VLREPLDQFGGGAQALAPAPNLGRADQAEQPRVGQRLDRRTGELPLPVDLDRRGLDRLGDHHGEVAHVRSRHGRAPSAQLA
jgi:hypothetical protein